MRARRSTPDGFGSHHACFRLQPVARAIDGEPLLVEQVSDPPYEQHFVMLVIAAIATPFDRFELRELLFPVAKHVRLDRAEVAHLADGEVALGWDRRKVGFSLPVLGHGSQLRPSPSASGWRGR